MRRKVKCLIGVAMVMLSFFFMKSSNVYAQEESDSSYVLPGGKTEEFFRTQTESIIQYNQLLNKLKSQTWSRGGKTIYEQCYGGAYLNDDGELVVLLSNNTYANRERMKEYTDNPDILLETCTYSYNELQSVINSIRSSHTELKEIGAGISSMYIDVINNRVVINVQNLNAYKESEIRKVIDSSCMVIQNTEEVFELQEGVSQISVNPGSELINLSTSKKATFGFAATRNGVQGYVTAGHFGKAVGQQISYNGSVIGTVTRTGWTENTYADAAFIESNGVAVPSTAFLGGYHCTATLTPTIDFPVNTVIYMYGKISGLQSGKLNSYTYDYIPLNPEYYTVTDHVIADYKSAEGDSGAPIFIYTGWNNGRHTCTLIGIHSAGAKPKDPGTAIFAKYGNIATLLNITAITE